MEERYLLAISRQVEASTPQNGLGGLDVKADSYPTETRRWGGHHGDR
jgi:hypothetical protein